MAQRILITFAGTRGDAQPYMVAAHALQEAGFEVMTAGNVDTASLAEAFSVPFCATRMSGREMVTSDAFIEAMTEQSIPKILKVQEEIFSKGRRREELEKWYQLLKDYQPHLILSAGLTLMSLPPMARQMQIPILSFQVQRWRPSRYATPFGFPKMKSNFLNLLAWKVLHGLLLRAARKKDGPFYEEHFKRPAGEVLMSLDELFDLLSYRAAYRSLIAESRSLHGDFPPDFNDNNIRVGPMMPPASLQVGPEFGSEQVAGMEAFLAQGDAPVFFGYGSMICKNSKFMTLLSLRALKVAGLRGILCAAWSEMSLDLVDGEPDAEELRSFCKDNILFMKFAPHGLLFPRCCAIVHHGGAGTTNASARSGVPTIVLPLSFDQFEQADMVNQSGIGVGMKVMHSLAPEEIAEAIQKCRQTPGIREKAREVGLAMEKEDGPAELVDFVKAYMKDFVENGRHLKIQEDLRTRRSSWLRWCLPCC
ncbi:UGT80B1 [Symbiodinium natans]|uniref:UGT80B1 protein n=1 Tax=Symbiodinium natans TaxID=878477 RepID=A0A812TCS6_9DINO|nr:UGT80B1 [Symbiodinium natans]